ncbi:MAG TPA: PAS domain S-box protein [Pyrinomonadaceae bacterium]|jgi:PAS domain S-box-containing protein
MNEEQAAQPAAFLRDSDQTLQTIIQASPLAIIALDTEGLITLWNSAAERIYGWREEEVLGRPLPTVPMAQREELQRNHRAAVAGRNFVNLEVQRQRKDGTLIDVAISTAALKDADGRPSGVLALIADVTERKRAEAQQFQLAAIVEGSDDAIISKDLNGTILSWNSAAERLYGYTAAEAIGQPVTMVIPPDRPDEETRILERIKRGERVAHYETVRLRKDGVRIDVSLTVSPLKDATGQVIGASKIARDITERKRSERALRRSEERNQALLNAIPDLIFRLGRDGRFLDVHAAHADALFMPPAEFIGQHVAEVLPADVAAEALRYVERAAVSGELQVFEYAFKQAGETRNYEARVVASGDEEVIVIVRDVTRRKRAEANERFLADATASLVSSLDYALTLERVARLSVPDLADYCLVDITDEDTGTIERAAVAHSDPQKAAAWRAMQRRWPLDPAADYTIPKVLRTGQPLLYPALTEANLRAVLSNEEQVATLLSFGIVSSMIVPLTARGRTFGTLSFLSAESERQYGAADLAVAEELARRAALAIDNARLYQRAQEANRAKDEFLATLSHELRTPLTPVIGWVHMLSGGRMTDEDIKRGLGVIDKNSQSLARLINDLLDMSAILNGKMRIDHLPVTIDSVVQEAVETVRPEATRRGIEIAFESCANTTGQAVVSGDRTRLGQVCWNLLSNAVKFSDEGGRVSVHCAADEREVRITVADEGIGIAPEFLPHVFERFRQADMSTTKSHGGLGIGLALVKSFVEAHAGTVTVESAGTGQGSRFIVCLPRLHLSTPAPAMNATSTSHATSATGAAATNARPAAAAAASPPARPPRMLLVEDADDTLELLRRTFTTRGYCVTACSSATEAQKVAAREHFDIIVSDIGLPHIDGYELLERLRAEQPALRTVPAVALTGYATPQDIARARAAGFATHLAKPIDPTALARVVAQLLTPSAARTDDA